MRWEVRLIWLILRSPKHFLQIQSHDARTQRMRGTQAPMGRGCVWVQKTPGDLIFKNMRVFVCVWQGVERRINRRMGTGWEVCRCGWAGDMLGEQMTHSSNRDQEP